MALSICTLRLATGMCRNHEIERPMLLCRPWGVEVGVAHGLLELGPAAIPKRLSSSVHQHRNIITAHTPHETHPSTSSTTNH
jgi:hypothetical protein